MLKVVLTGGIACGKTTVRERLEEVFRETGSRLEVFDADACVHRLLASPEVAGRIGDEFGASVIDGETGGIDRGSLRERVLGDEGRRRRLEGLLHPMVFDSLALALARRERELEPGCFLADIPLYYEAQRPGKVDFDLVLVVGSSRDVQRDRLLRRPGVTSDMAVQFLNAQFPVADKVSRADLVVWNDGTVAALERQVDLVAGRFGVPLAAG